MIDLPLLVVAPHPDDASLACAGLMQAARGSVYVVHVTSGDGYWRDTAEIDETLSPDPSQYLALGKMRMREARDAAAILRIPKSRQLFLGFPDGAMARLLSTGTRPITSLTTGSNIVPYADAYNPGAPYTYNELKQQLTSIVQSVQPGYIAYPTTYDTNSDHRSIGIAMRDVLSSGYSGATLSYLVHHYLYPGLFLDWDRVLRTPEDLAPSDIDIPLSRAMEHTKEAAVMVHWSQDVAVGPWLQAFVAKNEPFWSDGR